MKKSAVSLVAFFFFMTAIPQSFAAFTDIRSGSQLETYVNFLVGKKIISGYPDGSFKPERTINRAEALKIIFETVKKELEDSTDSGFSDVPKAEWYAKYVTTAKKKNIVKGYPDGKFKPNQEVNRAEFIKMTMSALPFFNTISQEKSVALKQYKDVYDLWYIPYVSAGLNLQFLNKTSDLKPDSPMQRQDAVEIVYRISKYLDEHPDALTNSGIPYVPEESFMVDDPMDPQNKISQQYHAQDFGPDKLIVKKDIGRTEIYNIHHGYNIVIDEVVHAWGNSQDYYNLLHIDYPNGCIVDISTEKNEYPSAQDYFERTVPDDMVRFSKRELKKINTYPKLSVYQDIIEWDLDQEALEALEMNKITLSYFIFSNGTVYLFNAHSPSVDRSVCEAFIPLVLSHFTLR